MKKYRLLLPIVLIVIGLVLFFLSWQRVTAASNKVPFKTPAGTWTSDKCPAGKGVVVNGWCWVCPTGSVGLPAECKITGSGADSYCSSTGYISGASCNWQLWTATPPSSPSPTPSSDEITISGELLLNGATDMENVRMMQGAEVTIENHSDLEIGRTTSSYNKITNKVTYSLTVDKEGDGFYTIYVSHDGFIPEGREITTSANSYIASFVLRPTKFLITGQLIDKERHIGIPNARIVFIWVDGENVVDAETGNTDKAGRFILNLETTSAIADTLNFPQTQTIDIKIPTYLNYGNIVDYALEIKGIPVQHLAPIYLNDEVECLSKTNIYMCWYGAEANEWRKDAAKNYLWEGLDQKIGHLKSVTGLKNTLRINIESGVLNAYIMGRLTNPNRIYMGTQLISSACKMDSTCSNEMITHEYGHIYYNTLGNMGGLKDTQAPFWKDLYHQVSPNISPAWLIITDKTYNRAKLGGHPYSNDDELFASTFFIMDNYKTQFQNNINASTNLKYWYQKMYDEHQQTWAYKVTSFLDNLAEFSLANN